MSSISSELCNPLKRKAQKAIFSSLTVKEKGKMYLTADLVLIKFKTGRIGYGWNFVLVIRTCMLHKFAQRMPLCTNSGPQQTINQIWSAVFISKSASWEMYAQTLEFPGSNTEGYLCFIRKRNTETVNHHFTGCPAFKGQL